VQPMGRGTPSIQYASGGVPRRLKDGDAEQNVRRVGAALVRTAIALAPTPKRSEFEDRVGAQSIGPARA
jgi:hypothetical protein